MQKNNTTQSDDPKTDIGELLASVEMVLKKKMMIMQVAAGAFVLSAAITMSLPNKYASTAMILPPQQNQDLSALILGQMGGGAISNLAGNILGTGSLADQYATILQCQRIQDAIIDRFNLMEVYKKKYRVDMYNKMGKIVSVEVGRKDGIISITVQDEDSKKAAEIANAYVDELGQLLGSLDKSTAGKNKSFVEDRLTRARADLSVAEDAVKAFQSKYKAINVIDQAKASIEGVAMLKAQLAIQESQLSALRSQFTDSTQEVQSIKATINNLKSQLAGLEGTGTGAIPSVGSVPALGQEQIRLLREFKTQEMIVEMLTKQHELLKLSEAKDVNGIQIVQKASVPDKHVKPKRAMIVVLTTFAAIFFTIVYVFIEHAIERMSDDDREKLNGIVSMLKWNRGSV